MRTGGQYPEPIRGMTMPGPGHVPYREPMHYRPGGDVRPSDPAYRGFGAPLTPYPPSPFGLPMTMGYGRTPSYMEPRPMGMPRGAYSPFQRTYSYS